MLKYTGAAFRKAHGKRQIDVAAGVRMRRATLVSMERNQGGWISRELVGRIVAWFRSEGIACDVSDLLEYVPDEEPHEGRNAGG